MHRIVGISDMQAPEHDVKAVKAVQRFLNEYDLSGKKGDQLLCVGDDADLTECGKWVRNTKGEHGNLQRAIDITKGIWTDFREVVPNAPITVHRSNHTDRLRLYLENVAPALESLRGLSWPHLAGYDELEIVHTQHPYDFAPGWCMIHGDEFGLSSTSGTTAFKATDRLGKSVLCGHTHRMGWLSKTQGGKTLSGIECGHLMDLDKVTYSKAGPDGLNWQSGFVIFHVSGEKVYPTMVPIIDKTFVVEGVKYSWR